MPNSLNRRKAMDILHTSLSAPSPVSAPASFFEHQIHTKYNVIGRGTCGTVFEVPETDWVLKKAVEARNHAPLRNDFSLTNHMAACSLAVQAPLREAFPTSEVPLVPTCYDFVDPGKSEGLEWWEGHKDYFPVARGMEDNVQGAIFRATRIPSLPKPARDSLIDLYFLGEQKQRALADPVNDACLVRVYLGKRRTESDKVNGHDNLENFPLCLDQIEELGLDPHQLASEMALALATAHWGAGIDCQDVEFVLGGCAEWREPSTVVEINVNSDASTHQRKGRMWMLDFDKAATFTTDGAHATSTPPELIPRLIRAVTGNDPYFPQPPGSTLMHDQELWKTFRGVYRKASKAILGRRDDFWVRKWLPDLFLKKWERWALRVRDEEVVVEFGED